MLLFFMLRWLLHDTVWWDESSIWPTETDFTVRLHGKTKFHSGKTEKVSTWHNFSFNNILLILNCKHACVKLFFHPTWAGWNYYMGSLHSSKVAIQQFKRGIPSYQDKISTCISRIELSWVKKTKATQVISFRQIGIM